MQSPAECSVRSQSAGKPTSCPIDFLVPGLEGHHFVAWGTDGGLIDVGFFQAPQDADAGFATSSAPGSWRHLVSLDVGSPGEAVTHLAFGGGPHVLLAAATPTRLAVFSLEPLLDYVFQADSAAIISAAEGDGRPWELPPAVHAEAYHLGGVECFPSETAGTTLLAISWTHQLDGLLASDSAGGLAMWQLRPLGAEEILPAAPAASASLRLAWSATAPDPQDLISAGVSVDAPSASAATAGEKCANVWWPEGATPSQPRTAEAVAAAAGSEEAPLTAPGVLREKLKHPYRLQALEWCPGVLRKDVFATDLMNSSGAAGQSPVGKDKDGSGGTSGDGAPIEDHPALMTLGADGTVRLWVEMLVVHHNPPAPQGSSAEAAPPAPPTLDSFFAMALVVDPKAAAASAPADSEASPSPSGSPAAPTAATGTPQPEGDGAAPGRIVASWVRPTGSMLGRQRSGGDSEVLWLVVATEAAPDPSNGGTAGGTVAQPEWVVQLYAVRGLTAVVVANLPGSMAGVSSLSGGAGGKRPQAVLWGQHRWAGAQSGVANRSNLSAFSAWMTAEDDFPRVTCFDAAGAVAGAPGAPFFEEIWAAGVTYATVRADAPTGAAALSQRMDAAALWRARTAAHAAPLAALAVAPSGSAVVTLDAAGGAALWDLRGGGVQLLAPLTLPTPPAAPATSACLEWLPPLAPGAPPHQQPHQRHWLAASLGRSIFAVGLPRNGTDDAPTAPAAAATLAASLEGDVLALLSLDVSTPGVPKAPVLLALHAAAPSAAAGPFSGAGLHLKASLFELVNGLQLVLRPLGDAIELPHHVHGPVIAVCPLASVSGGVMVGTASGAVYTLSFSVDARGVASVVQLGRSVHAFAHGAAVAALAAAADGTTAAAVGAGGARGPQLAVWKVPEDREVYMSHHGSGKNHQKVSPVRIVLDTAASSVTWVEGLVVPCVAVGDTSGAVTLYAPTRDAMEGWRAVAALHAGVGTPVPAAALRAPAAAASGSLLAAVGPRLLCLSDAVVQDHEAAPLSKRLVESAGPLPQYHPRTLRALLLAGRRDAAGAILQSLAVWAPQYAAWQTQQAYCRLYRTASEAAGGGGGGDAPTPRVGADPELSGPPAFPAVPLDQFLDPGLAGLADRVAEAAAAAAAGKQPSALNSASQQSLRGRGMAAVESGQFDTAAWGDDCFGSVLVPAAASEAVAEASTAALPHSGSSGSAMDTGMLDMSAFGGFGMDLGPPQEPKPAAVPQAAAPSPPLAPGASSSSSAMDTGMLDMAAFGVDFMPPAPPPPAPEPTPPAAPPATPPRQASPSRHPPPRPPPPPPVLLGVGSSAELPEEPPAASMPPLAPSSASTSSIETGALDLAAFGMDLDLTTPNMVHGSSEPAPVPVIAAKRVTIAPQPPSAPAPPPAPEKKPMPVLGAPKQAQVAAQDLQPFSMDLLTALHRAVGLAVAEDTPGDGDGVDDGLAAFSRRSLPFLGASDDAPSPMELARRLPPRPLPALTPEETQEVVALATFFTAGAACTVGPAGSSSGAFGKGDPAFTSTVPLDESGAVFLAAVALACADPLPPPAPLTSASAVSLGDAGGMQSSISMSFSAPGGALGSSASFGGAMPRSASASSAAALMKRSKSSARNAAGVEYTLAPSMASTTSLALSSADEEEGEGGAAPEALAQRWGLAPGLNLSAVVWALMSGCQEAVLEHASGRFSAREAEGEAAAAAEAQRQAEAEGGSSSAADFYNAGLRRGGSGAGGASSWPLLRALGAGFWMRDPTLLATTAEALARSRFAARRNPDDAALLYAALGKKTVLQGLYRTSNQARQADFLGRDFSQPRHQQAACKNAFVLLGNHRQELAAAFFILGGSPGDAVSVCVRELGDVQLALFVARLIHGDGSEAERALIERHVIPAVLEAAGSEGGGGGGGAPGEGLWGGVLAAWMLGDGLGALRALLCVKNADAEENSGGGDGSGGAGSWDAPDGLVQQLPAVSMLAKVSLVATSEDLSALGGAEALAAAAAARGGALSDALHSAGLPALALQPEAVVEAYTRKHGGDEAAAAARRAAWAAAAALLPHPPGAMPPAGAPSPDHQLLSLRAAGLEVDRHEALRRLAALQRAVNPAAAGAAGGGTTALAPAPSVASLFSPRAAVAPAQSGLFRQGSFDTTRSTHSTGSHSTHRPSGDGGPGRRPTRLGAGAGSASPQGPLADATLLFHVDADSLHGVACCPLISPEVLGRPVVAATHRSGLLEFAAQPPPPPPEEPRSNSFTSGTDRSGVNLGPGGWAAAEEDAPLHSPGGSGLTSGAGAGQAASIFSRFLTQIFDQTSWAADPIERGVSAADGDMGLAVGAAGSSTPVGTGIWSPLSPAGAPFSPLQAVHTPGGTSYPVSNLLKPAPPASAAPGAGASATRALALAAHPSRQLFLSGDEASGRVHLWQFGGPRRVASFTPVAPSDLPAAQADSGLLSFSFGGRSMGRSQSVVGRLSHWGGARGAAFSPGGERFAAVGDGGVVATWRLGGGANRPTDVDGALCAEWWHHCLNKEGRAVCYLGGGSSVVAVGGRCTLGNVAVWDAASPPAEACVGRLKHHSSCVTALCTMPGGWLLAAADAAGALSLTDVRMLGGAAGGARVLWSVRASKGAVQALTMLPLAATDRPRALAMGAASGGSGVLVTGGQDGVVRVWQASSGKLIQSLEGASGPAKSGGKGLLSLGGGGGAPAGVTGLAVCDEGVVCCGADGSVKLYPLRPPEQV